MMFNDSELSDLPSCKRPVCSIILIRSGLGPILFIAMSFSAISSTYAAECVVARAKDGSTISRVKNSGGSWLDINSRKFDFDGMNNARSLKYYPTDPAIVTTASGRVYKPKIEYDDPSGSFAVYLETDSLGSGIFDVTIPGPWLNDKRGVTVRFKRIPNKCR